MPVHNELLSTQCVCGRDFGGINDWQGEILQDYSDTILYNYYGGDLPEDILSPVDYNVTMSIHSDIPELSFRFEGSQVKSYGLNYDQTRYSIDRVRNKITSLTISDADGSFHQEFLDLFVESVSTRILCSAFPSTIGILMVI